MQWKVAWRKFAQEAVWPFHSSMGDFRAGSKKRIPYFTALNSSHSAFLFYMCRVQQSTCTFYQALFTKDLKLIVKVWMIKVLWLPLKVLWGHSVLIMWLWILRRVHPAVKLSFMRPRPYPSSILLSEANFYLLALFATSPGCGSLPEFTVASVFPVEVIYKSQLLKSQTFTDILWKELPWF